MLSSNHEEVQNVVNRAVSIAQKQKSEYVMLEHLLIAIITEERVSTFLSENEIDVKLMEKEIARYTKRFADPDTVKPKKTHALERVFNRAFTQAMLSGRDSLELYDVCMSILAESRSHACFFMQSYGIDRDLITEFANDTAIKNIENMSVQEANNILREHCENLNVLAEKGKIDPVIGRSTEIDEISQVLAKRNKSNILMVGDPGVGKTAIAEGLALKIVNGEVPEYLHSTEIWNLDIGSVLAGCRYRGDFEEKIKDILGALKAKQNCILFIDEAHQAKGAGSGANTGTDLSNMIKPAIAKGDVKVIASTTWDEFKQSFEKDRALMRRFHVMGVDEPSPDDTLEILRGLKKYYEQFHKAKITVEAIEAAVQLSVRHMPDKKLPDKAIDLIDTACAAERRKGTKRISIKKPHILEQVSLITRVPISELDHETIQSNLGDLEPAIKSQLFGQDHVVDPVLDKVFLAKANLKSHTKPIGSFIFLGPTGTGKTELAKQLSEKLSMKLLRYDMSEYQEKHAVAKLIGAPPGYVGFEGGAAGDGGMLINDIQQNPHSVLLLDEFEKAHPDVINVLLQLLDEGTIQGSNGKRADARNCIVILTSNLGAEEAGKPGIGFGAGIKGADAVHAALNDFTRPEFRNRVDGIHAFNPHDDATMTKIVHKFIEELNYISLEQGIRIDPDDDAIEYLVKHGFDPAYGARPLRRLIEKEISIPVAKKILFDKIEKGATIQVSVQDNKIALNVQPARKNEKAKVES